MLAKRHVSNHDDSTGCRVGGDDGGSQRIDGALQDDEADGKMEFIRPMEKPVVTSSAHGVSYYRKNALLEGIRKREIPVEIQKAEHTGDQLGHERSLLRFRPHRNWKTVTARRSRRRLRLQERRSGNTAGSLLLFPHSS